MRFAEPSITTIGKSFKKLPAFDLDQLGVALSVRYLIPVMSIVSPARKSADTLLTNSSVKFNSNKKESSMNSEEHFAPIAALDLDPIKVKLMHQESGEGWSRDYVDAVEFEYRRFLYLMKKFPNEHVAPLVDVDVFWHYHILDTMKYAADCEQIFGYFLHHFPYSGLRGDDELDHQQSGARMQQLYAATFGATYCRQQQGHPIAEPPQSAAPKKAWCSPATAATAWCSPATANIAWCSPATATSAWCSPALAKNAWCTPAAPHPTRSPEAVPTNHYARPMLAGVAGTS